jgi:hypothetical protein
MYKGINDAKKRENLQDVKLVQNICQNLFMSKIDRLCLVDCIFPYKKSAACNKLVVEMGDVMSFGHLKVYWIIGMTTSTCSGW